MKAQRGVYEKVPGSNVWWVRYADSAGRIRREKAGVKSAAIKLYRKRKTEILEGKKLPDKLRAVVRISDLTSALLRDYQMNEKRSYQATERRLRLHVLPFFGAMIANEVGTDDLDRYVDERRPEGAENATINREIAALKRIYNLARKRRPPKVREVPPFPHLKENPPRRGFVIDREYEALMDCAVELWLKAILAVAYTFGLRRSELLHLKVRQIDSSQRTFHLDPGSTKNDEARTVKMTREVQDLLAQCIRNKKPEDYVFTRADRERVLDFRGAWYSVCERAGLGRFAKGEDNKVRWEGLIFHDLRRSAVRNMVRRGVSERVAMMLSGHKTRSVFDRYNIVSEADLEEAAAKIERGRGERKRAVVGMRKTATDTRTSTTAKSNIRRRIDIVA